MSTKTKIQKPVSTTKTSKSKTPKSKMDHKTVLSFYNTRKRDGDLFTLSKLTGYSKSHICNVSAGRRNINAKIADAMYSISRRRRF
jgi:hypothetical protein